MKRMNAIAFLIATLACAWTIPVSANLLSNAGFESGSQGQFGSTPIPGWTTWGTDGWHHGDYNHTLSGSLAVKTWSDGSGLYQDFAAIAGTSYDISSSAFAPSNDPLRGWNGVLKIDWFGSGSFLASQDIGNFFGDEVDPFDTWKTISGTAIAPIGADQGRLTMVLSRNSNPTTNGALGWDDVSVELTQVPEPSSVVLMGLGLVSVLGAAYRRT